MKKNVLVIAGLALVSTSAFASKARIESFGNNANLYIKDQRNIFRNAATVNSNTNMIVTEWGKSQSTDSSTAPRAEGGFFRQAGSLNYGLYLGNNDGADRAVPATATAGFLNQDNALDLFIGGDAGLQWGARLHYANSKNEIAAGQDMKNNAMGVGAGIVMGQLEVYTNVTIADKSEGMINTAATPAFSAGEYKTKPSFTVGAGYDLNGTTIFAEATMNKADVTVAGTKTTEKENKYLLGAGRVMELTPTARVFGNVAFEYSKEEDGTTTKSMTLPVAFGFEADATSWLTLRGSVGQNVALNDVKTDGKKSTEANTTNVTAGASLTFGKLALDGYVGTQATGKLDANNMFSRVGVTYNF